MLLRYCAMCNCSAKEAFVALQQMLALLPCDTLLWLRNLLDEELKEDV
nr:hypothetical protein XPJYXGBL_XPJYXGBL_CDS_0011 [Microvirus sp.]